jgi:hypothetical protein
VKWEFTWGFSHANLKSVADQLLVGGCSVGHSQWLVAVGSFLRSSNKALSVRHHVSGHVAFRGAAAMAAV